MACPKQNVVDRFVLRTKKATNGCVLWSGGQIRGYGSFNVDGKTRKAHRIAYELFVGPIPTGMMVLHNCPHGDDRLCVNPAHLWVGTNDQNMADMVKKNRQARQRGENHGGAKLTRSDVDEIRRRCGRGDTQTEVATAFGVDQSHVSNIVRGKLWSHH
jgi:hypothetical protein